MTEYVELILPCCVDELDGLKTAYDPDEIETQFTVTHDGFPVGATICLNPHQTLELINFLLRAHHDMGTRSVTTDQDGREG